MRQVYTLHPAKLMRSRAAACSVDDKRGLCDVVPVMVYDNRNAGLCMTLSGLITL